MEASQLVVEFTRNLVRTPSVLGQEKEAARLTAEQMRKLDFDQVSLDEAGSVVGLVEGVRPGPTLLCDAHLDTVDVLPRGQWTRDPFGGELVEGRIYGRGSSDMKGALAAMTVAAGQADRERMKGRVVISASVEEERLEGAALSLIAQRCQPDFVVIGESSDLKLVTAGRGRAEFVITTHGQPAHASSPQLGENAVHKMVAVIKQVESLPMPAHPSVGKGVMCLTDIISVPYPAHSVVPSGCRATYERRLVPGEPREDVLSEFAGAFRRADAGDTSVELAQAEVTTYTGYRWDQEKWLPPWEMDLDHPFVQSCRQGLVKAGLQPSQTSYQFCTNAAYSAGVASIPTVGFGPSTEKLAHTVDEYIEVDDLMAALRGYSAIIGEVLGVR